MQSKARDVTTYIAESPAERQGALTRLRELCLELLTRFEETRAYSGSSYKRNGEVEVGFASQKHFIGLYILRTDVVNAHRHQLQGKGISAGKGAIRYSRPERIDFDVVKSILRGTVDSTGPVCGRRGAAVPVGRRRGWHCELRQDL
jgi:uncharacterized protein YdhG (YjbR/CyaY superfamily)